MKKKLLYVLVLVIAAINISCDDAFSPKAGFEEKYILYSILEADNIADPARHYAIVSKLYDVPGYDPMENHTDPTLVGAKITIERKTVSYPFVQDTTRRTDTSRYTTPIIYYQTIPMVALKAGDKFVIKAELPNGKILRSETQIPYDLALEYSYDFQRGLTTKINQFAAGYEWNIFWDEMENGHLYFIKLMINYRHTVNGVTKSYEKEVPIYYKDNQPIYPGYTFNNSVNYAYSALDKVMAEISAGDTAKSSYKIDDAVLTILDYNPALAKYYSSINGSLDKFSVRLDETVFTNIQGGLGVFGSFKKNRRVFEIARDYTLGFGYTP